MTSHDPEVGVSSMKAVTLPGFSASNVIRCGGLARNNMLRTAMENINKCMSDADVGRRLDITVWYWNNE